MTDGFPVAKVLRLFPQPATPLAAEDVYTEISFPILRTRPYVVINMVASLDGKASLSGKAGSIGSSIDRLLMRTLRAHADAVMIGAGTLRAEKLTLTVPEKLAEAREARGLKPQPLAVVATATGEVPLEKNLLGSSPDNLLVFVSPDTTEERLTALSSRASVEVVVPKEETAMASSWLDLKRALELLKHRYTVDVLLVEGGPALNHTLISLGLADELFLTLAPKLLGGDRPTDLTILEGPRFPSSLRRTGPELTSIHLADHEMFLRYTLK